MCSGKDGIGEFMSREFRVGDLIYIKSSWTSDPEDFRPKKGDVLRISEILEDFDDELLYCFDEYEDYGTFSEHMVLVSPHKISRFYE